MKSLAVKYRPRYFKDVVEQGSTIAILQEQLRTESHLNCYLLTGGAGTGKTTIARIFANEINKHKGTPIEIDAASNNGVEDVREIISNAKFKSLDSDYKVYIIDECHMLSTGAWNAMLKLLEEPPAQTVFIFCTTDPQKIPATILSRVQRYDFKRITHDSIVSRLEYIIKMEGELIDSEAASATDVIPYEMDALHYIAKLADGGMRDAITLLDKCISFAADVTLENVIEALGTVDYDTMIELTMAMLDRDSTEALKIVDEAYRKGIDLKQFIKQYMYLLVDLCKYDLLRSFDYLKLPPTYADTLDELSEDDFDEIRALLSEIRRLHVEIKWEQTPKPVIEACIIMYNTEVVADEE